MDDMSREQRRKNMQQIKSKDTKPEEIVRKYLFSKGLRYRKNDKRYPGKPDIVLPKYKTVVFVNGCFWHMHEGCRYSVLPKSNANYWIPKLKKNKERDEKNISELEKLGWRVILVWECSLSKHSRAETLESLFSKICAPSNKC